MGQCISRWQVHSLKRRECFPSISRVSPVSPRNTHVSPVSPNLNHNKGRLYLLYLPESHSISRVSPVSPRKPQACDRETSGPHICNHAPIHAGYCEAFIFPHNTSLEVVGFLNRVPAREGPAQRKAGGSRKKFARGQAGEREEGR